MNATRLSISVLSLSLLAGMYAVAQDKKKADSSPRETVARPMTEKERKKKEEKLRKELETPYRKWLNEDVAYIITDEERTAFKRLQTDEEREQFIEQFWLRRDPTPDSIENEFKEEHYRRIAYTNENFASGIPGWKTDRGRIYITYGPPDEKETHPSGGTYERPSEEGGGTTSTFPFETWRYRYIEGVGSDIIIEFVDPTMSGEYRMTMDPSEKDALLYVPGRRPHHDGTDGDEQQDGPLQPHRWDAFGRAVRGGDREDEPVQPVGAVRQVAAPAGGEVQRSGSRGEFADQLQHSADEGARRISSR